MKGEPRDWRLLLQARRQQAAFGTEGLRAGIEKNKVIILIEDIEKDEDLYFIQAASQLMKEGFTTDIYDSEEITKIAKLIHLCS